MTCSAARRPGSRRSPTGSPGRTSPGSCSRCATGASASRRRSWPHSWRAAASRRAWLRRGSAPARSSRTRPGWLLGCRSPSFARCARPPTTPSERRRARSSRRSSTVSCRTSTRCAGGSPSGTSRHRAPRRRPASSSSTARTSRRRSRTPCARAGSATASRSRRRRPQGSRRSCGQPGSRRTRRSGRSSHRAARRSRRGRSRRWRWRRAAGRGGLRSCSPPTARWHVPSSGCSRRRSPLTRAAPWCWSAARTAGGSGTRQAVGRSARASTPTRPPGAPWPSGTRSCSARSPAAPTSPPRGRRPSTPTAAPRTCRRVPGRACTPSSDSRTPPR